MTDPRSLPLRPSLDSLRKQAKKLSRDVAAGHSDALSRVRMHLPHAASPITQRNAQLVIAREYGYPGWKDLIAEVSRRLGQGLEWAVGEARRVIHDNDVDRLKQLLIEFPALLSWQDKEGGVLGMATGSYGDSFDPGREENFTRAACAEILIDAGAIVTPPVLEGLLESRTRGLLRLFDRKSVLPRTIRFLAALGDRDAVRDRLDVTEHDSATVNAAFMIACHFKHDAVASLLLERATALDAELGRRVDTVGRAAFITFLSEERALTFVDVVPSGPWQAYLMERVMRAVQEDDMPTFAGVLQREPWLLGDDYVRLHVGVVERAILRDRGAFIEALFGMMPALVTLQPPPRSGAIEFAFTYAKTHLLPILTRVWPIPDDLPHAAGTGDFARVKHWLDQPGGRGQRVLDHALAWSVLNRHFDVADCLLEHGADINTRWASHEPASLLHELVFRDDYDAMRFLIDRGIDMTITDYRWRATAQGWARYGANDEKMAAWLADAERQQKRG